MLILDQHGRMVSTREPQPTHGPLFTLIGTASGCAWAIGAPTEIAAELDHLAREEPPIRDPRDAPLHTDQSLCMLRRPSVRLQQPVLHAPPLLPAGNRRFISHDPIGIAVDINVYAYVGDDPVDSTPQLVFARARFMTVPLLPVWPSKQPSLQLSRRNLQTASSKQRGYL